MKKLIVLPILVFMMSCNCKKAGVSNDINKGKLPLFEIVNESEYQGREMESFEIIKDEVALKKLYESINNENVPAIDFSKETVVAAFLGQKNSGGHSITIKNVVEKDNTIYVEIEKRSPKSGENATMAITNPYSIAKIFSTKKIIIK